MVELLSSKENPKLYRPGYAGALNELSFFFVIRASDYYVLWVVHLVWTILTLLWVYFVIFEELFPEGPVRICMTLWFGFMCLKPCLSSMFRRISLVYLPTPACSHSTCQAVSCSFLINFFEPCLSCFFSFCGSRTSLILTCIGITFRATVNARKKESGSVKWLQLLLVAWHFSGQFSVPFLCVHFQAYVPVYIYWLRLPVGHHIWVEQFILTYGR